MKKLLSLLVIAVMLFTLGTPAYAATLTSWWSTIPVVSIAGDSEPLYDGNGNQIFKTTDILSGMTGDDEDSDIMGAVANVLYPFLVEGLLFDKWDNYYNNLYEEIADIFEDSLLTKDGEPKEGSGLSEERKKDVAENLKKDAKEEWGCYLDWHYKFYYDWRLDPLTVADQFNDYIKAVKEVTGAEKVAITGLCLGTNVILAYISKYGTDDIYGLGLNGSTVNGMEPISEAVSGKIALDGNSIMRLLIDCNVYDVMDVDDFILKTVDLANKSGLIGAVSGFTESELYEKLEKGVTSALARASVLTWPGYWATVKKDDFETAKEFVFGPEGSELRTEYAGLIKKLDDYHENVRVRIPELLTQVKDSGANLAIIAKYGCQMIPLTESQTLVADQFASVNSASFGATTSTVYDTLSEEYIAGRVSEGKGKYISPDKQIDASTCLFPDNTWFIKGNKHSNWSQWETEVLYTVTTADRQLTVDDFDFGQYVIYDKANNYAVGMTEENCHIEAWEADKEKDYPTSILTKIKN
ncbi:MAG: hypothetical protein IJ962_00770, partial [Clostridia bacterium]|nr:hypothetical protein [Clostridia bacterium]